MSKSSVSGHNMLSTAILRTELPAFNTLKKGTTGSGEEWFAVRNELGRSLGKRSRKLMRYTRKIMSIPLSRQKILLRLIAAIKPESCHV